VRLFRVVLAASLLGVGGPLFVSSLSERLIFQPTPGVDLRPEQIGLESEDVYLESEPGIRIHAFYLPSPGASRAILFLHGNAGNASHRLPNAAELVRLGAHVLLLDYRGYGLSQGAPSEEGTYADARAALRHLLNERGLPESRIILFGRSLGGAVAVDLAQDRKLGGVVLESTFTSARDMARAISWLPFWLLMSERFDSISKISRVRVPLLFFHGDRDEIVPVELGRALFEAAREPKAFETLRGASHNDTVSVGGRGYFERIGRFLDEVAPPE
jgi:fermentation-respiration switch protein FrsA (DUF1100 family)